MGLGEPKEATPATLKEFGSKTNGTAENNECTLDDAKMAREGGRVASNFSEREIYISTREASDSQAIAR